MTGVSRGLTAPMPDALDLSYVRQRRYHQAILPAGWSHIQARLTIVMIGLSPEVIAASVMPHMKAAAGFRSMQSGTVAQGLRNLAARNADQLFHGVARHVRLTHPDGF